MGEAVTASRTRRGTGWGAAVLAVLATGGCSERVLETGLTYGYLVEATTGEEPAKPARNPLIRNMSGSETTWPRVYDVPDRPPPLPSPAQRQAAMDRLAADRRAAHLADEVLKEIAAPLTIPPPPVLGPPGQAKAK
jgi:hypothetical protein